LKILLWWYLTRRQTAYKDIALFPVRKIDYPYDASTVFNVPSSTEDTPYEKIGDLLIVDYRYARFALDPKTGLFSMVRSVLYHLLREVGGLFLGASNWRDSSWNGLAAIQNGLNPSTREQRSALFGPNSVDIQGKSTVSLLIDEVGHASSWVVLHHLRVLSPGHSPVLCIPNRKHNSMVAG